MGLGMVSGDRVNSKSDSRGHRGFETRSAINGRGCLLMRMLSRLPSRYSPVRGFRLSFVQDAILVQLLPRATSLTVVHVPLDEERCGRWPFSDSF